MAKAGAVCGFTTLLTLSLMWGLAVTHSLSPGTLGFNSTRGKSEGLPELLKSLVEGFTAIRGLGSETCSEALFSMLSSSMGSSHFTNLLMYSGKKVNDLGNYLACSATNESHYFLVGFLVGGIAFVRIGMCLPQECHTKELQVFRPQLASFFSSITGREVEPQDVSLIDVKAFNNEYTPTSGVLAFWLITGTLLLLIVIATCLEEAGFATQERLAKSTSLRALQCFSFVRNIKGIFNTKNSVDANLEVFNGLRVISIAWIALSHTYENDGWLAPTMNIEDYAREANDSYSFAYIKGGSCAVDVFFFLSGFLAAMSYFASLRDPNKRNVCTVLVAYLHRYLRLFPILFFSAMFLLWVMPYVKDEPSHPYMGTLVDNCRDNWGYTFSYLANFRKYEETCVDWNWYVMIDMQFYLVAPLLVLPFFSSEFWGYLSLGLWALASIIVTSTLSLVYNIHFSRVKPEKESYDVIIYTKPYCRILPYLLGILMYMMYKNHKKKHDEPRCTLFQKLEAAVTHKPWFKYVTYAIGAALIYLAVHLVYFFDKYPNDWAQWVATVHDVTFRPVFIIGLMCLIYPTLIGKGEFVLSVLGHPIFNPLGKITYGVYMLQLPILYILQGYSLNGHFTNSSWLWFTFCTGLFITYLVSFVVTLIFESPVLQLLKTFLEPIRKQPLPAGEREGDPKKETDKDQESLLLHEAVKKR